MKSLGDRGLCGKLCNKCTLFGCHCGGCSLCEACVCEKKCSECYALCSNRPQAIPYLMSLGGPEIEVRANQEIELPAHIPVLPDIFRNRPKYEIVKIIGVHGGNMLSRNGEKIIPSYLNKGFAAALNVDDRTEGILHFYVKDRSLEGLWDNRNEIYKQLNTMKFKAIIAPNFSVYEDAPRLDHIYNIKRTSVVYNEMLESNLTVIPDISWYDKKDLDKWIKEINKNNVKTIAFSLQVVDVILKASNVWKTYLLGFRYLCMNIDPKVRIIIIGITSPRRMHDIFKAAAGQKISVLNQSAFVQSRRGMLSENRQENKILSKDELFEKNIIYFNRLYDEMNEQYKGMK